MVDDRELMRLVNMGCSDTRIASIMGVSRSTITKHRRKLETQYVDTCAKEEKLCRYNDCVECDDAYKHCDTCGWNPDAYVIRKYINAPIDCGVEPPDKDEKLCRYNENVACDDDRKCRYCGWNPSVERYRRMQR